MNTWGSDVIAFSLAAEGEKLLPDVKCICQATPRHGVESVFSGLGAEKYTGI
jgi:hypothetical protein